MLDIEGYDNYILPEMLEKLQVGKFLNKKNIVLLPNLTHHIRFALLPENMVANGAVALLASTDSISDKEIDFLNSVEFKQYFDIIRNKSMLTVNIDKNIAYFIGGVK